MRDCQSSESKVANNGMICFHCPYCGDTKLVSHFDAAEKSEKVRHFWVCQGCGNKFRDFEDLLGENKHYFTLRKRILLTLCGFLAIFGLWLGLMNGKRIAGIGMVIAAAVLYAVVNRKLRIQKKKRDVEAKNLCWKCYR